MKSFKNKAIFSEHDLLFLSNDEKFKKFSSNKHNFEQFPIDDDENDDRNFNEALFLEELLLSNNNNNKSNYNQDISNTNNNNNNNDDNNIHLVNNNGNEKNGIFNSKTPLLSSLLLHSEKIDKKNCFCNNEVFNDLLLSRTTQRILKELKCNLNQNTTRVELINAYNNNNSINTENKSLEVIKNENSEGNYENNKISTVSNEENKNDKNTIIKNIQTKNLSIAKFLKFYSTATNNNDNNNNNHNSNILFKKPVFDIINDPLQYDVEQPCFFNFNNNDNNNNNNNLQLGINWRNSDITNENNIDSNNIIDNTNTVTDKKHIIIKLNLHRLEFTNHPLMSKEELLVVKLYANFNKYKNLFENKKIDYLIYRSSSLINQLKKMVLLVNNTTNNNNNNNNNNNKTNNNDNEKAEVILMNKLKAIYIDLIETLPLIKEINVATDELSNNISKTWYEIIALRQEQGFFFLFFIIIIK
jgi:hypothetical protein